MGGGRSKREGIYVYIHLIHFVVQQKLTQHCRVTIPQFKKKKNTSFPGDSNSGLAKKFVRIFP